MRHSMIMAGGAGTRLWPMSRQTSPKQLIPFISGRSLLEIAFDRLDGIIPMEHRLICANESHRGVIRERLGALPNENILGEPIGRDTLNAVGFTAAVLEKQDPDAVFAVLTADHIIEPQDEFKRKLELGYELVEADPKRLVTFSIMPTYPATGYGYVQRGEAIEGFEAAYYAAGFHEKPILSKAQEYLDAGTFNWNSGMFIFNAGQFMSAVKSFAPEAYEGLQRIAVAWGTDRQEQTLAHVYPTLPRISVDYAIMERAVDSDDFDVCTVAMGVWWTDVGSWPSYGETLSADKCDCRSNCSTLHMNSHNVLAVSHDPDHVIATIGCENLIVIQTKDVTLICPTDRAEEIKTLVEEQVGETLK